MRKNGTPEILIGSTLLLMLAADHFLQNMQRYERADVLTRLQKEVEADKRSTVVDGFSATMDFHSAKDAPFMFRCVVRRIPELFDGTKSLTNVKVGDIVDVVEEGVGPGGAYNLCRLCQTSDTETGCANGDEMSIGWFPTICLEKISS